MSEDGGGKPSDDGEAEDDPLLRAIAAAPERRPEPPDPTRLAHFRIVGRLGAGGMGVVYRADDDKLRRAVALKVLPDTSDDEEKRQRFLREARSAAAVTHPNVAVVYEVDEADGRVYIAMELVEGESLRTRLQRGKLDVATAKGLALQIARGLAAAHEKGIVHRDLKPENVMITPSGVVKLLDFGLAKVARVEPDARDPDPALAKTATLVTADEGRVMGTPDYMSPEQAFGEPLDVRSDVFSFGIVLFEMLAGARPFEGRTTGALLMAIASDAAPGLREKAPDVDEATAALVMRCLAKKPGDRFATAGEIVAALEVKADATTRSLSDVAPVTRRDGARRSSRSTGIAAAAVLGMVGIGAIMFLRRSREPMVAATTAAPTASTGAVGAEEISRSSNPEAQRLFDAALRAIDDDTPEARPLLESAVKEDPAFAGAYLRMWAIGLPHFAENAPGKHVDEDYQHLLALQANLSPRDRELLAALDSPQGAARNARLDAYLARNPKDAVAWDARLDWRDPAPIDRALAADPTLAGVMAARAGHLRWRDAHLSAALDVATRCLERSPRSAGCTWERSVVLDHQGEDCATAEASFRRLLELTPDMREAHVVLGGILAGEGASLDAVRDALGTATSRGTDDSQPVEAWIPMLAGEFSDVERIAREALETVGGTATENDHWGPAAILRDAYVEAGDDAAAGTVAVDYLARRPAWRNPTPQYVGGMVAAAVRAGTMSRTAADRTLDAAFHALVGAKDDPETPADAWGATYAAGVRTRDEALAALARREALGVGAEAPPRGELLFLAGRGEVARAPLEAGVRSCSVALDNTAFWARTHLFLGELDEERHDKNAACGHFAKILERWGHAKPRSVTADEARAHAKKLDCVL